ncbi:hypothetical protein JHK85_006652 [Glycine max]|nr:hypothetical protein JHK85_006652 [Glycine max]
MLSNDWEFQGLREATFLLTSNSHVKHYHDAHHSSTFQPPFDLCGAPKKLWEDVYKAIEGAKYLVYIAGWSFNPMMVLPRKVGPVDNNNTHTIMNLNSTTDIRTSWVVSELSTKLNVERSIHEAYVEAIRRAERFSYIENQYFIGGCHWWKKDRHTGCTNLIPIEIALCKIKAKEIFVVYIVIPMWLEGEAESEPILSQSFSYTLASTQ